MHKLHDLGSKMSWLVAEDDLHPHRAVHLVPRLQPDRAVAATPAVEAEIRHRAGEAIIRREAPTELTKRPKRGGRDDGERMLRSAATESKLMKMPKSALVSDGDVEAIGVKTTATVTLQL